MIVKPLTEHHLEFLSLKEGSRGSSESTHVKMPHCWKSHALTHIISSLVQDCVFTRSSGSEFGERTGPNPGLEFGERIWPNPGLAGSEKGPFSEPAETGLYPVLWLNYQPAEPGLTWSNSELKLRTLGKNTILYHLDYFSSAKKLEEEDEEEEVSETSLLPWKHLQTGIPDSGVDSDMEVDLPPAKTDSAVTQSSVDRTGEKQSISRKDSKTSVKQFSDSDITEILAENTDWYSNFKTS